MFDYILLTSLFILGTLTKLLYLPICLFMKNTNINSINRHLLKYFYTILNYILTFIIGSFFIANCYINEFIIVWIILLAINIAKSVIFYKTDRSLNISTVREIIYTIISTILIIYYYSYDCRTRMDIYGGIIWGFSSANIIETFPKFYIFGYNYTDHLKVSFINSFINTYFLE